MAVAAPYIATALVAAFARNEGQRQEKVMSDNASREIEKATIQQQKVEQQVAEQEVKTTESQNLAQRKQRQRALSSKTQGRKGTILTTPQAELGQTPVGESAKSGTKTLLGA